MYLSLKKGLFIIILGLGWGENYAQTSTGPNSPAVSINESRAGSVSAWSDPGNGTASDNAYTSNASNMNNNGDYTDWLKVTDFGFSIPAGATIDSIFVETEYFNDGTKIIQEAKAHIVKGGTILTGTNNKIGAPWDGTDPDTYVNHGETVLGHDPLWGTTWTAADINASDFGFALSAVASGSGGVGKPRVDHIRTTVFYTMPLPVELLFFRATADKNQIILEWATASESNNDFFTIEKSIEGELFTPVRVVDGAGNSLQTLHYREIDDDPTPGLSFYRLKQTDFDGTFTYSNLVSIFYSGGKAPVKLFPNPVTGNSTIQFINPNQISTNILIFDYKGKVIIHHQTNKNNLPVKKYNYRSGIYIYRIIQFGITVGTGKFLVLP